MTRQIRISNISDALNCPFWSKMAQFEPLLKSQKCQFFLKNGQKGSWPFRFLSFLIESAILVKNDQIWIVQKLLKSQKCQFFIRNGQKGSWYFRFCHFWSKTPFWSKMTHFEPLKNYWKVKNGQKMAVFRNFWSKTPLKHHKNKNQYRLYNCASVMRPRGPTLRVV